MTLDRNSSNRSIKSRRPPFFNQEDAERETGKFEVDEMEISLDLHHKIYDFIFRQGIYTWSLRHGGAKTRATHTCNFTLSLYNGDTGDRAFLKRGGAVGQYKNSLKTKRYLDNPRTQSERLTIVKPTEDALKKFEDVKSKTPDINQMYFWIANKYPCDILWIRYWR